MDLLCYEDMKYLFVEETSECNICYEFFMKISNANNAVLYAALHVSIGMIILTAITIVQCADFDVTIFLQAYYYAPQIDIFCCK